MSALTVERVLAWRPEALSSAAGELEPTADGLDQSQHRVRAAGDALGGEGTGPAAAAQQRISADTRDAAQLAAAVRSAQSALRSGAGALGVPAVTCSASCTTHVAAASRSLTTVL